MLWLSEAFSNIALIKYMGKLDSNSNLPLNSSLSYTLPSLVSTVSLEKKANKADHWEPLSLPGVEPFALSTKGQDRFLEHLKLIKSKFSYEGGFIIRSCNNFPQATGLASSASSFAALTLCAIKAISELQQKAPPSVEDQAMISRLGSGSSCRSFFSPWTLWEADGVRELPLPYKLLNHQVILISHKEKSIPSREAHAQVVTSPFYAERAYRAEKNLTSLIQAFNLKDWSKAYQICWDEFQDMHNLFHSAATAFSYMSERTKIILKTLQDFWDKSGDGPIITMDAGPNVHLLYRPDQNDLAQKFTKDYLLGNYDVL